MNRNYCRKAVRDLGRVQRYNLRRNLAEAINPIENENINEDDARRNEHLEDAEMRQPEQNPAGNNFDNNEHPGNFENVDQQQREQNQPNQYHDENNAEPHNNFPDNRGRAADAGDEQAGDNEEIPQEEDQNEENLYSEGDESESDDEEDLFERHNQPIYVGANITVKESMMLVLSLMIKHNLTATCLSDLLTVIQFHCLNNGLQKVSLYKFTKFFSLCKKSSYNKHFYCSRCLASLPRQNAFCNICNAVTPSQYFIVMPFMKQLEEMFKRNNFYELLQQRFNRDNPRQGHNHDIYHGSLYRSHSGEGQFLSSPNNLSLMWYTDGVPVFKSAKVSMWPFYLCINELPYKYRMAQENMILAGLWFGKKKPEANLFLMKFRDQFQTLYRGRNFTLPDGRLVRIKALLLAGVADVPAKTHFLNLTLYSGAWGCCNCKLRGHTFRHDTGGHSHIFPYERDIEERTSAETIAQGEETVRNNIEDGIEGVRGLSVLSQFMPDFIGGTGIDVMHKVYGGCVKKLLHIWFDSCYSREPFSLRAVMDSIDRRLKSIKPPRSVHRLPRTVADLCHWKCSELKMWFYYYSLPVLSGIMLPLYFNHFKLLVLSISILNSQSISQADTSKARKLIHKFVREFPDLYGERQSTINVHGLLHLPDCVEKLGPLWVYSCFPFEDLNGKLLRAVHGTTNLDSQVVNRHFQIIKLQKKLESLPDGETKDFLLHRRKRQVAVNERIQEGCYSVGSYTSAIPEEVLIPLPNFNGDGRSVKSYFRLLKDKKVFVSESYNRATRTSSSTVLFFRNGLKKVGRIQIFLKVTECDCNGQCLCQGTHYAILKEIITRNCFDVLDDNERRHNIWHLQHCEIVDRMTAVPVSDLITLCVNISPERCDSFIGLPVNEQEVE